MADIEQPRRDFGTKASAVQSQLLPARRYASAVCHGLVSSCLLLVSVLSKRIN